MTFGDPFEADEPCDGMNCDRKETCARWIARCAITWVADGKTHIIGLPMHNAKAWTAAKKCPFWLAIPNEKYPGKNDVSAP